MWDGNDVYKLKKIYHYLNFYYWWLQKNIAIPFLVYVYNLFLLPMKIFF